MCDISFLVSLSLAIASVIAATSLDNTDSSGRSMAFAYQKHNHHNKILTLGKLNVRKYRLNSHRQNNHKKKPLKDLPLEKDGQQQPLSPD